MISVLTIILMITGTCVVLHALCKNKHHLITSQCHMVSDSHVTVMSQYLMTVLTCNKLSLFFFLCS